MRIQQVAVATFLIFLPASVGAQQFPDGPGKEILEKQCSTCHAPEMASSPRSSEEWQEVTANMRDLAAELTDNQVPVLVEYLTKHWGRGAGAPSPATSGAAGAPQDMPSDYEQVLVALGRQGDFKDGVLRINIPRNDLKAATTAAGTALDGKLDTAALAKTIGTAGESSGAVYKITIGRPDITITEMGAPINSRMGLNTWAALGRTRTGSNLELDTAVALFSRLPETN